MRGLLLATTVISLLLAGADAAGAAGREAVLKQIDLPHDYYWREQYIPQLTMGPSSVAFTPDGKALVTGMEVPNNEIRITPLSALTAGAAPAKGGKK